MLPNSPSLAPKNESLPDFLSSPNPLKYLDNDYLVHDYETTNKDKGSAINRSNRLILATWVGGAGISGGFRGKISNGTYYKFGSEYEQEELTDVIRSAGVIVAHNAKFELQWGQRIGIELGTKLIWDTMLGEFVLAGNRRWDLSLEATARRYGLGGKESLVSTLIKGGVCPSEIPENWLLEYGIADTDLCHQIFLLQRVRLHQAGLLPVMYTRCLLTPVLADIEMRGVQLDAKRVEEEYEKCFTVHAGLTAELEGLSKGVNWNSGIQVARHIYDNLGFRELTSKGSPDRTGTGRRRTDAPSLARLRAETAQQEEFLRIFKDFKKLEKKKDTLEKLRKACEENEGRLHAQFNQAIAGTHRLTSSGLKYKLQFQNIDRTIKELFRARLDSWLVAEADGSQLEFRIAAHLGRDPVALADIRTPGFDAHWQSAEALTGKPRQSLSKDDRTKAKPDTFRPLYGATGGDVAQKRYLKFFQQRYAGIYKTQTGWTYEVLRNKKLRIETGLIFYWPDTVLEGSDGRGYIRNRTAIFNYPIQSLATADIIPISLVYFYHRIKALGLRMFLVNTIHDSIIAEVPPDEADSFRSLAERCFTSDCYEYLSTVYGIDLTCNLGCETKVGEYWSHGEERKYDREPDRVQERTT